MAFSVKNFVVISSFLLSHLIWDASANKTEDEQQRCCTLKIKDDTLAGLIYFIDVHRRNIGFYGFITVLMVHSSIYSL
jgi:hypothetical protein